MNQRVSAKAAFLDRDGVINADVGYLHQPDQLRLTERAAEALALLQGAGYLLIVVTNQSGIGRGYYGEADFSALTDHLAARLHDSGVDIAATYHCPHAPDAGCECRKPLPGLLLRAIRHFKIDPAASIMIGDKASDIAAGRAAGVRNCYLIDPAGTPESGADAAFTSLWACAHAITGSP